MGYSSDMEAPYKGACVIIVVLLLVIGLLVLHVCHVAMTWPILTVTHIIAFLAGAAVEAALRR